LVATGGSVSSVPDGAGGCHFTVLTVEFEDIPPFDCGLANIGFSDLSIDNNGNSMEVVVSPSGGAMSGNQSIIVNGTAAGTSPLGVIDPTPIEDLEGILPEGSVTYATDRASSSYDDDTTLVAAASPVVSGVTINISLTGLRGELTFAAP